MSGEAAAGPIVVSVHDIAPGTAAQTMRWLADLDARGICATLLLMPGPWRGRRLAEDPELAEAMLEAVELGAQPTTYAQLLGLDPATSGGGSAPVRRPGPERVGP